MYTPNEHRYEKMVYNRCGKSGLKLPAVSFGIWQNFSNKDRFENMEQMIRTAFDLGITYLTRRTTMVILITALPRRISERYSTVGFASIAMK